MRGNFFGEKKRRVPFFGALFFFPCSGGGVGGPHLPWFDATYEMDVEMEGRKQGQWTAKNSQE